ncbi:hypothetical protein MD484_g1635, partial [Candolleomyces efflorescens]
MARTKRAAQASAPGKVAPPSAGSPEYVPDDYEVVETPIPSASKTPSTPAPVNKRRVREDVNPTPTSPSKKRRGRVEVSPEPEPDLDVFTQKPPMKKEEALSSDDEDTASTTAISVTGSADSAPDGDFDDDTETPKPSKSKGKKPAGNLKTSLGGTIGTNTSGESLAPHPASHIPIVTLPSIKFSQDNKSLWADSYIDGGKTHLFVKARPSDDALLARRSILDPYMVKHGHYKNLPKSNPLQLYSQNESQGAAFTNGALTSHVPGLSISTWSCFGVDSAYIVSLLRMKRQGQYVNTSTIDVTELVFKETYSRQGPCMAFTVCDKDKGKPVTLLFVGAAMESFLRDGKAMGQDGNGPTSKCVVVVGHRFEYEVFSCKHATLWHADDISSGISRRHITFQTRNRPNSRYSPSLLYQPLLTGIPGAPSDRESDRVDEPVGDVRVGKLEIKSYESPTKKYVPSRSSQTSLDFSDEVPVYDGCDEAFDPSDISGSLARLPPYPLADGEIPEGSGVVVGYSSSASKWASVWRLTFYIQWVVVIAD